MSGAAAACAVILIAMLASGCAGLGDETAGWGEVREQLAAHVDGVVAAALAGLPAEDIGPPYGVVCRSAGGVGPGTGEYHPEVGLEFKLRKGDDPIELLERVLRYWESQGHTAERENFDKGDPTVRMRTKADYGISVSVIKERNIALLGASGPCAKPGNIAELQEPIELRALR